MAIKWISRYFKKIETTHEQQRTALNLVEKIVNGFVAVIGVTLALKVIGLDISLLVSVGVLGLSYGLKDIIKNYIAGILIFFKGPFKIGDIVKIKKYTGKIDRMDFQSTGIKTFDNRNITIYNSDIMTESIENYSRYPVRRMEISVKLGYGTNVQKAAKIFEHILATDPDVQKTPKYSVIFSEFETNCFVLKLKFWVKAPSNMLAMRSRIGLKIQQAINEESIFGPYQKTFELNQDMTLTPDRKKWSQAMDVAEPEQPIVEPVATQQVALEFSDADEPEA
ncbi:MAG: hypothetical protein ACD_65C00236G0001 [uncultured bacterium]|nr:MAG: hypothetical protein ACD_65C00236G0001 [uncultured bacterium]